MMNTPKKENIFRRLANGFRRLDRLTQVLLVAFIVLGLASGVVAFSYMRVLAENAPSFTLPGLAIQDIPSANTTAEPGSSQNVYSYPVPTRWDGSSRINVLVMGLDTFAIGKQEQGPHARIP